jgi:signal transduction histidine kinase
MSQQSDPVAPADAETDGAAPTTEATTEAPPPPPPGVDKAALSELFASLAHDMRSPLGVVSQAFGELRTEFAEDFTDEHRLLVELADRGLLRLGHIADALGLVAALDAGDFKLRRGLVDLYALVRAATASGVAIERRREVALACDLPEGTCRALADEARLGHAVCALVINAVRHARRHARVTVEHADGEARFAVEDDGQGVSAERRATLYRRFEVRRSRSGLGLGLSIAHDLIIAHGGRLALEPSTLPPGRPGTIGARFVVSLPVERGP